MRLHRFLRCRCTGSVTACLKLLPRLGELCRGSIEEARKAPLDALDDSGAAHDEDKEHEWKPRVLAQPRVEGFQCGTHLRQHSKPRCAAAAPESGPCQDLLGRVEASSHAPVSGGSGEHAEAGDRAAPRGGAPALNPEQDCLQPALTQNAMGKAVQNRREQRARAVQGTPARKEKKKKMELACDEGIPGSETGAPGGRSSLMIRFKTFPSRAFAIAPAKVMIASASCR